MKFLFITDNFFMEQLGLMYICAVLKKSGLEVGLVKITEDVFKKAKEFCPDVIGYSVITGNQDKFLRLNSLLKKNFKFVSVMGGPHATFFPDVVSDKDLDYALRGEGEQAIAEFIAFLNGQIRIESVHNLSYKEAGKLAHNPLGRLVDDLDTLPFPDRGIFLNYPEIEGTPIRHFIASRGCPFQCTYCFNEEYYSLYKGLGRRVRFRSAENVVSEIKEVAEAKFARLVYFQDDTFIIDKKWLAEFSRLYKKEVGLPYHCHVRANLVDKEIAELLKSSNCVSVHIAIESGNEHLRNTVLKRAMAEEEIINACALLKKYRIKFMLQNIIGLPGGSISADLETLKLNIKCAPTYAWVSIYQPYPGTPLAEYSIKKGLFDGDFAALGENFFDKTALNFSEGYKRKIENLQKLFALIAAFPFLYYLGIYRLLLALPRQKTVKALLKKIYLSFRKSADYRLLGVRL